MIPVFELPHRLRRAREAAGFEQVEFAQRIGVARSSVTNWETGKTTPKRMVLNAWSLATGVPVEWLETGYAADESRPTPADMAVAVGDDVQRARRDSNPQPSDPSSAPA